MHSDGTTCAAIRHQAVYEAGKGADSPCLATGCGERRAAWSCGTKTSGGRGLAKPSVAPACEESLATDAALRSHAEQSLDEGCRGKRRSAPCVD